MDLSIVILNWNAKAWLERCLGSALAQETPGRSFEVIFVDNASDDGSAAFVKDRFPGVKVMALPENIGFARGNNAGIKESTGRVVLLLNPDTVTHPGAFAELLDFMEAHLRCGVLGPKLENPDGSLQYSCRRFATLEAGLFRNTPMGRLFPNNRATSDYLMQDVPHDRPMVVDWVSGAAMTVRREVFDAIGLLDEGYFFAVEDVDFCYSAHTAGWDVWYDPDAVITHAIGHSSDQNAIKVVTAFHTGMFRFFRRHYLGKRYPLWLTPVVAAGLAARAAGVIGKIWLYRVLGRKRSGP